VPGSVPSGASRRSEKAIPYSPVRILTLQTAPRAESAPKTRFVLGIAVKPLKIVEFVIAVTFFTTGEGEQRSMVQMFKNVARVFTRSQTPDTRANLSGEISVMPLRPVALGKVYRMLTFGKVRSGF
jgi:hypothetical protein